MGLFKKKADPISERARVLNAEIGALEQKIRRYEAQIERRQGVLAAAPSSRPGSPPQARPAAVRPALPTELRFEEVDQQRLTAAPEPPPPASHFNEFGVRKYDLPALLGRLRRQIHGPAPSNPKLVTYLAAGGVQGLRPLRYEKRVARNRFIALVIVLFLLLLGMLVIFLRHR